MRKAVAGYFRQFAELVTDWLSRYRDDPFFRTEVNVISLQISFSLIILGLVGASFAFLYSEISHTVVEGIRVGITSSDPSAVAETLVSEIDSIRQRNLLTIIAIIASATALFGYVVARVTLAPARNALAAQKQFIGNIAHEVRTPLSVIKTNTEVALLEDNVSAEMRETLRSNIEELDRVSDIINNLLSLSALVKPERMEFSSVDLSAIATDVVQKFSQLAKRGEHQITLRKNPEAQVWGNATALQQVVGNLLKNAISYTARGGHIRVTVDTAPNNQVELVIQDSGIGIARKDLFRIFEPFFRADPSRTKGAGGSGLGLAIVSELVKIHHGKMTIRSAVGRGTTVSILFPAIARQGVVGNETSLKEGLSEIAVDFSKR